MKSQWQKAAQAAAVTIMVALTGAAHAGSGRDHRQADRPQGDGPGERFMAAAVEACVGKSAGAEVSLSGRDGSSIAAVCSERPAVLLAVPKAHLERLAQAKAACKGLTVGASAVLATADGRTISASCQNRDGELLAVPTERLRKRER